MNSLHAAFSEQFFRWEQRGRGWQTFEVPVWPEPPFEPFCGHHVRPQQSLDDGRRPTFFSSLVANLATKLKAPTASEPGIEEDSEPEPEPLQRGNVVEFFASLPATAHISKEISQRFISSLSQCREPIAFELLGLPDHITTQVAVSYPDADLAEHQLQAHFPEAVFTKQVCFLEEKWNETQADESAVFEFGLAREFMLQIAAARNFDTDPFIGLAAAMSNLRQNELALFQVIFQPVSHPWHESILRSVTDEHGKNFFVNRPELADEAREKIAHPLYAAVVRIAVKSNGRMLSIARDLAGALTVYSNPGNNWLVPLQNTEYPFPEHQNDLLRRQSRRAGMILNGEELVSIVHLPSESVRAPKLRREVRKLKAAPAIALRHAGLLLGTNRCGNVINEVRLTPDQRIRHTYIVGASGTGKSTLFFNLIKQDMESGQGLAVFDPHGDLIDKILGAIPEHRIDDVVLVDPGDETHSVGFNILSAHSELEKNLLASDLVSVFQRLSTSWGDQMSSVLNNAILAFLESSRGGTLADLQRFLIEPAFRSEFLRTVKDSQVLYYWTKAFPQLSGNKSIGPVVTRLGGFLDKKPIRLMVTQNENRINFAEIMNTGKIFLAKLAQGLIGNENAYLLGSFMVSKFQQMAMSRQAQAAETRRDFWCYCDEFHNFITPSMAQILSGARKYRLGLILAHQNLQQLERNPEVSSAVASCFTRIVFRVGDDDAKKLAQGFASFETHDLQNLETGEAICRIERSDNDFNLTIPYPDPLNEEQAAKRREEVITASRKKYARPRSELESSDSPAELTTAPTEPDSPAKVIAPLVTPNISPAPLPEPEKEIRKSPSPSLRDSGRGGVQHQAIQKRIKEAAENIGFRSTIEHPILDGQGSVDLFLDRSGQGIACEISISTTIDHEVGNVSKCIKAGIKTVAVICVDEARLNKIAQAVTGALGPEVASRVTYYEPDPFIAHLKALVPPAPKTPDTPETRLGYKIKRSAPKLSLEEQRLKEDAAYRAMVAEMQRRN